MFNPLDHPLCLDEPRRLREPDSWVGHIPFAWYLLSAFRPRSLVELGVYVGNSYLAFCQGIQTLGLETRCHGVDTWQGDAHLGRYPEKVFQDLSAHHDRLYGSFSTLVRATFDHARTAFEPGSVDLLHIDGLHTYEGVRHDFETWLPALSSRGLVLFHDTNVWEPGFGVFKFWREVFSRYPSFEFKHSNGLGVLAVGPQAAGVLEPLRACPQEAEGCFQALGERLLLKFRHLARSSVENFHQLYLDTGGGFSEAESLQIPAGQGKELTAEFEFGAPRALRGLRFDPVRDFAVIALGEATAVLANGETAPCPLAGSNAEHRDRDVHVFGTRAPSFFLTPPQDQVSGVRIRLEIRKTGEGAVRQLLETRKGEADELAAQWRSRCEGQETVIGQLRQWGQDLERHLASALAARDGLRAERDGLREEVRRMEEGAAFLQRLVLHKEQAGDALREQLRSLENSCTWRLARLVLDPLERVAALARGRRFSGPGPLPPPPAPAGPDQVPVASAPPQARVEGEFPPLFRRPVTVIVPVYNGLRALKDLLDSLALSRRTPDPLLSFLFIDDGSPDPGIAALLAGHPFSARSDVQVLRNGENLGFVATVNRGLDQAASASDVVILNSDTQIFGHPFEILQDVALRLPGVASVTPLTNRGTIACLVNWPHGAESVLGLAPEATAVLVEAARIATPAVPAPTGVGFCMYMTREALDRVGLFDQKAFGRGYGEENDWCQRAAAQGLVNLISPETFVHHAEGCSFQDEKSALCARNAKVLAQRHPDYEALVACYVRQDPLGPAREALLDALGRAAHNAGDGIWLKAADLAHVPGFGGPSEEVRALLSRFFIAGDGIEIGALHGPLPVPPGARVTYVDRISVRELRKHYPELARQNLVEPGVIDDGERLSSFADSSQDFIIANHFIEHAQDPIQCLQTFSRVLAPAGVLFLAAPDRRATFDRTRTATSYGHLVQDHEQGAAISRQDHYLEWAEHVNGRTGQEALERARELESMGYSIHFHCWAPGEFSGFLDGAVRDHGLPLRTVFALENGEEFIFILRKVLAPYPGQPE